MTDDLDDGTARRAFVRALHESTVIADRIREAIADAPPKLVMLALSDLLQEQLTHLVMVEPDRETADGAREALRIPTVPEELRRADNEFEIAYTRSTLRKKLGE
jgi:hypothetical protein